MCLLHYNRVLIQVQYRPLLPIFINDSSTWTPRPRITLPFIDLPGNEGIVQHFEYIAALNFVSNSKFQTNY